MGNLLRPPKLTDFQKAKILHEFKTFYDLNGDGRLTWKDFEAAQIFTCKLNGWDAKSDKRKMCDELFRTIWMSLQTVADSDENAEITGDEWLKMWETMYIAIRKEQKEGLPNVDRLPMWLHRYLLHRFHLFDRTGDGFVDVDEFEYVLSNYNVSAPACKKAWMLFTKNGEKTVTFDYFCDLAAEYYFSNDPAALGNFITGKLDFSDCIPSAK